MQQNIIFGVINKFDVHSDTNVTTEQQEENGIKYSYHVYEKISEDV